MQKKGGMDELLPTGVQRHEEGVLTAVLLQKRPA
jgi:hypothetical protein